MTKKILRKTETDRRVARYLSDSRQAISLDYVGGYNIERDADGSSWLTVRVWLDMDRFEEPLTEQEE